MGSKERYVVQATTIEQLVHDLNFALQRIGDRLDKIEGLRGNPEMRGNLDMTGSKIVNADLEDDSEDHILSSSSLGG